MPRFLFTKMIKTLAFQNVNYEKAINKAINNQSMEVKEKHVRSVIMGTFSEKGARMFWRVALGFSYTNSKPVAWKLCYVLHKMLREGHSLCCYHSQGHKTDLKRIGKAWQHSNENFAKIIRMYTKLLTAKLEFHFHHPDFPGHLNVTLSELQLIVNNDINDYFQLSVDILEYLNHVLQFQEAVFAISGKKNWKCTLAPLVLTIQESSQLYNHCVKILFILHSYLPTESLQGHRIRFEEQFTRLKAVYSNANKCHMFTVPSLPEKAPNFLIEANLPLEFSRISCRDFVNTSSTNYTSNAVVEQNLIDLSDPPIEPHCFLSGSHQMRIENTTAPPLGQNDLVDPFDTSFLDGQQSTGQPPLSPIVHQMCIENMIAQQSKTQENSFRSDQVQPELRSTGDWKIHKPFNNSYNGHLNILPSQRPNFIEENSFDQFKYNGDCRPSAPPLHLAVIDHQIHVEAIKERDNYIQYLRLELEKLRHQNYRMESDNFKKFQEKITSLEKSLFANENQVVQGNQVPGSLQYRSFSVLENNNFKHFSENIEERQITGNLPTQDKQAMYDKDEIDQVQNGIKNLKVEDKIRDIEQQIDLHMKNKNLEVWNNNRELFNIKTEILNMSLENLIKEKQTDVAEPEEEVKKKNLIKRKFKKITLVVKVTEMKIKK